MLKNIGYHTRLDGKNSVKVTGGSFGGSLDVETANRLVRSHFTVIVKPSGRPVFVDRGGREVSLYISVDPEITDKGIEAMSAYRKAENERRRLYAAAEEATTNALDDAIAIHGHDAVMAALTNIKGA